MAFLYLDIETIPSQSPDVHARIAETVTCPGNISKPETVKAWETDKKPGLVKEAIAKTSFDGALGHICCIGWAWNDDAVLIFPVVTVEDEREALASFTRALIEQADSENFYSPVIVGHCVASFDIRFLWQRAIVLGVRMPAWFPRDPKPWGNEVFDTMTAFAGAKNTISADRLARALGLQGKDEVDGSMVAQMWAEGRHGEIAEYCRSDVEMVRSIHRRMMIAFGEAA